MTRLTAYDYPVNIFEINITEVLKQRFN